MHSKLVEYSQGQEIQDESRLIKHLLYKLRLKNTTIVLRWMCIGNQLSQHMCELENEW